MSLKIKENLKNRGHGPKIDLAYSASVASLRYVIKLTAKKPTRPTNANWATTTATRTPQNNRFN